MKVNLPVELELGHDVQRAQRCVYALMVGRMLRVQQLVHEHELENHKQQFVFLSYLRAISMASMSNAKNALFQKMSCSHESFARDIQNKQEFIF